MSSRVSAFAGNTRGSVAIEFAILGSLFFGVLFGHIIIGYLLFLQHRLDDATISAARSIQVGVAQNAQDDTAEKFKQNRICPALGALMDCRRVIVDTGILDSSSTAFDSDAWDSIPVGSRAGSSFCIGATSQYMFMRVSYAQPAIANGLLPFSMFTFYNGQPVIMIQSFAAWRIEPVTAKKTGPCQ